MTKADEFWEKYKYYGNANIIDRDSFLAALQEYGEAVRAEAVKVCRDKAAFFGTEPDELLHPLHKRERESYRDCAAAIEKMKLP